MSTSCGNALRLIWQKTFDDKSTLVEVMAECCQATSHYLSQCNKLFTHTCMTRPAKCVLPLRATSMSISSITKGLYLPSKPDNEFQFTPHQLIMEIAFMITSSNENISRVTGLFCRESTGPRWIPRHKGQWRRALMFSLIWTWTKGWVNNRDTSDLRCHHAH